MQRIYDATSTPLHVDHDKFNFHHPILGPGYTDNLPVTKKIMSADYINEAIFRKRQTNFWNSFVKLINRIA